MFPPIICILSVQIGASQYAHLASPGEPCTHSPPICPRHASQWDLGPGCGQVWVHVRSLSRTFLGISSRRVANSGKSCVAFGIFEQTISFPLECYDGGEAHDEHPIGPPFFIAISYSAFPPPTQSTAQKRYNSAISSMLRSQRKLSPVISSFYLVILEISSPPSVYYR